MRRAAFEEAKEAEEAEAGRGANAAAKARRKSRRPSGTRLRGEFRAEGDGAERLLELARRGKRRVAFY